MVRNCGTQKMESEYLSVFKLQGTRFKLNDFDRMSDDEINISSDLMAECGPGVGENENSVSRKRKSFLPDETKTKVPKKPKITKAKTKFSPTPECGQLK